MIDKREQNEIENMKEVVDKKIREAGRKEQKLTSMAEEAQVKKRTKAHRHCI